MRLRKLSLVIGFALLTNAALANKPDPRLTEVWSPVPAKVTVDKIPSDAIALLSDEMTSLDNLWQHGNGNAVKWSFEKGVLTVQPKTGSLFTKQSFCDMQLHLEWRAPAQTNNANANSGIKIQKRYEVQILEIGRASCRERVCMFV